MSINYEVGRASSVVLLGLLVQCSSFAWLFGGPLKEAGVPYVEKLRHASYAQFGSIFDWRVVLMLSIFALIFTLGTASSSVIGIELSKRILSGRLRLRASMRKGLRYRLSRFNPITLGLSR